MEKDLFGECPYVTFQKLLAGKWSLLIMHFLSDGSMRFNELKRCLPNMTHTTLSKQLKALEENGLIVRKEYPQIPPKVEYSLSDIGRRIKPVLDSLRIWGDEYIEYLKQQRGG